MLRGNFQSRSVGDEAATGLYFRAGLLKQAAESHYVLALRLQQQNRGPCR